MDKKKRNRVLAIVGGLTILMISGAVFSQIYKNHQANQLIIDKCLENFKEVENVAITKDGFWSPVKCERG